MVISLQRGDTDVYSSHFILTSVLTFANRRPTRKRFIFKVGYEAPCVRLLTTGRSSDSDRVCVLMYVAIKHESNATAPISSKQRRARPKLFKCAN